MLLQPLVGHREDRSCNHKRTVFIIERFSLGKRSFLKNGPTPASFFQTQDKFYNKYICEKMSLQYTVPGFEPTTFGI